MTRQTEMTSEQANEAIRLLRLARSHFNRGSGLRKDINALLLSLGVRPVSEDEIEPAIV